MPRQELLPPTKDLEITYRDPTELKPRPTNPRSHSPKQIKQVGACILEMGFISTVLIDALDQIIAGHARVEAAKLIGLIRVPTVRVDHLTPEQIRAYVIADNQLAANAGWNRELLALELQELSINLSFDVTITGFETAEIDLIIGERDNATPDKADEVPVVDRSTPPVSKTGDLFRAGHHYLLCGNALKRESYCALLGSKKAQLVITDAPYNVRIDGNVTRLGKHREFAMASGELSPAEFTQFLKTACDHLIAHSTDGSLHFLFMDWRHTRELLDAAAGFSEQKNICVWVKTNAGMGSFYRSQHEFVHVFKNGTAAHINNVELGRFGRNRSNVWTCAGVNSFGKDRDKELAMHPTVKPVALLADAIMDASRRGGIVLDPFAGSGSTLIAAERTGRRGYGIEIDPHYVDTILRRFEDSCGVKAIHVQSNLSFDELRRERSASREQCDGE